MKTGNWFGHGKLLLTGEYLVMKGAKALALPLKPGQSLEVRCQTTNMLSWHALTREGTWFKAAFSLPDLAIISSTDEKLTSDLKFILSAVILLNPGAFIMEDGWSIRTELDFDPNYGFGSSSTLISNLSDSAGVDPYELLKLTFGGSGYDIACARSEHPIFYELIDEDPQVTLAPFDPPFKDHIYFVYLGKKQVSKTAIREFNKNASFTDDQITRISQIGIELTQASSLETFEDLIDEHEEVMSEILGKPKVKSVLFPDHQGSVKSLGAWGGDFVLMTSAKTKSEIGEYLLTKGLNVFFTYDELVLS
jgi:mevalonate kinase